MTSRSKTLSLLALTGALTAGLTGCYTQLATRGHGAVEAPAYGTPADSALDSAQLAARAEAQARESRAPTVIVNNYYDPYVGYRGYRHWEWDYPALTIGYYSSRYGHYSRPYWWDDPWYSGRRSRRHHHHHRGHDWTPSHGGGGGSAAQPLFSPEPDYPRARKGRRADPEPAPAPSPASAPAPKRSDDNGSSSGSASPSSGGSQSSGSDKSGESGEYRSLKKGKRR